MVNEETCQYQVIIKMKKDGLGIFKLLGGGGIVAHFDTGVFKVAGKKVSALQFVVIHSFPVHMISVLEKSAAVVSKDTVIVPVVTGICPQVLAELKKKLEKQTARLGENMTNMFDTLTAWENLINTCAGIEIQYMSITFRGLPYPLSLESDLLQDKDTRKLHDSGITPAVAKMLLECEDDLEGGNNIPFNCTW